MHKLLGIWLVLGLSVLSLNALGQVNLVLNPSFEQNSAGCVSTFSDNCTGSAVISWDSPTYGTPDWYNTCGSAASNGVPQNYYGFHSPKSGASYAGFAFANGSKDYYEYIQGQLNVLMTNGQKYCVTYYVSLVDSMWYASSSFGVYLSSSPVCITGTYDTLPYTPQIVNPVTNVITDRINWSPISGEYKALGGEQYVVIGSFDSITPLTFVGGGGVGFDFPQTYYYVDDVSVREIKEAHAGNDTAICNGDKVLIGQDTALGVTYHWQPTTGLTSPNSAETFASPTVTTTYTLVVVNDSMKGCNCPDSVSRDSVTITVCELPNNIFIPTAFSPNGDGQNDILFAKGNNVAGFYIALYDRWGNKVYESNNLSIGWDGIYGGKPMEAGTFVYYASGTYIDGTTFNKKGNVTLIR